MKNIDKKNKTAEIVVVVGSVARIKKVAIVGMNDDAVIINNINNAKAKDKIELYNKYVLNPKNIQEGQIIN